MDSRFLNGGVVGDNGRLMIILYQSGSAYDEQIREGQAAGEIVMVRERVIDLADLTSMNDSSTKAGQPDEQLREIFLNATGQLNRTDRLIPYGRD